MCAGVTPERVKNFFGEMCVKGKVERFELPNLGAVNLLLHGALGGGGIWLSLRIDAQGKTMGGKRSHGGGS